MLDVGNGIIIDVETSPGNRIDEVNCTSLMLDRIESTFEVKPKRLMGDTFYGTAEMRGYLVNEKDIEPHVRVWDKSKRTDGTFSTTDFKWVNEHDHYECPAGKLLKPRQRQYKKPTSTISKDNTIRYRASKQDCDICEYKVKCCPNTPARKIARSVHENARDVARRINQSDQFIQQSSRERKKVEMAFAHMKRILNFTRLRLRGMKSANDECLLVATAQNLRKLVRLCPHPPPGSELSMP